MSTVSFRYRWICPPYRTNSHYTHNMWAPECSYPRGAFASSPVSIYAYRGAAGIGWRAVCFPHTPFIPNNDRALIALPANGSSSRDAVVSSSPQPLMLRQAQWTRCLSNVELQPTISRISPECSKAAIERMSPPPPNLSMDSSPCHFTTPAPSPGTLQLHSRTLANEA